MKKLNTAMKSVLFLFIAAVFVFGADKKSDNNEVKGSSSDNGVFYEASFEEEGETDAFITEAGELEWKKEGADKSKGCIKVFNPEESQWLSCEKGLQWTDNKTTMEFDYFLNGCGTGDFYIMARGSKGKNVRVSVQGSAKGKWGHAKLKAAYMKHQGVSGRGDTFKNLIFVASGIDKENKEPYMLIDNIIIKSGGSEK